METEYRQPGMLPNVPCNRTIFEWKLSAMSHLSVLMSLVIVQSLNGNLLLACLAFYPVVLVIVQSLNGNFGNTLTTGSLPPCNRTIFEWKHLLRKLRKIAKQLVIVQSLNGNVLYCDILLPVLPPCNRTIFEWKLAKTSFFRLWYSYL